MTPIAIMVASVAGVVFLIYVFAALCKESRRGPCRVVQILWHPEQDDLETPAMGSREVLSIDARAPAQHAFGVGEGPALRVGR